MRLLILLFFSSFFTLVLQAQIGTGTWRLHVATGRAIDVASSDTYIYTAYENGLMRYDFTSKEKRLYTAINGISDIELKVKETKTPFIIEMKNNIQETNPINYIQK